MSPLFGARGGGVGELGEDMEFGHGGGGGGGAGVLGGVELELGVDAKHKVRFRQSRFEGRGGEPRVFWGGGVLYLGKWGGC
jgi:hypothetical protein